MHVVDRDERVYRAFDAANRERFKALVTPELIAEHQRGPRAIKSDDLLRILDYFRRGPVAGKYVAIVEEPFARWRIGVLSGVKGQPIEVDESEDFHSEPDVQHAIFLRRLRDMGALS